MSEIFFLAGGSGMVGSALARRLKNETNVEIIAPTHSELDLTNQAAVQDYFKQHNFTQVYFAAALVGSIHANNTYPAEFIYQNLMMECNVIHAAHQAGIEKLLFLAASCVYPKLAQQPMSEEVLLRGPFEPTNEPYAAAKLAGMKLCESYNRQYGHDYRIVMPASLYGPGDNFHLENAHVIPGLIRRFHEARHNNDPTISIWGSGNPRREFMYVDDMADACVYIMDLPKAKLEGATSAQLSQINIGTDEDCSIAELASTIRNIEGYTGEIVFDTSKPDGMMRKLLDTAKLKSLGWQSAVPLEQGLKETYFWFMENQDQLRS